MKKLLIVAAIAAIASFAHAGAYIWGFGSGADAAPGQIPDDMTGDGYLSGGTAMLFLGTVAQTATGSGSGIDAAYNLDFSGATLVGSPAAQAPDPDYNFGQLVFDKDYKNDAIDAAGGQAYTLILFDQDGVTDYENYEGYYYVYTGTSLASYDADSSTAYADLTRLAPVNGSDWRTAALASPTPPEPIPEPTSGLLVMLGIAGLALKRKKA